MAGSALAEEPNWKVTYTVASNAPIQQIFPSLNKGRNYYFCEGLSGYDIDSVEVYYEIFNNDDPTDDGVDFAESGTVRWETSDSFTCKPLATTSANQSLFVKQVKFGDLEIPRS